MDSKTLEKVTEKLPLMKSEEKVQTSEYESPTQIVAIWSDAVYTQPGSPPIRGFGGRLYFYNNQNRAFPVEGQLAVYGYDDSIEGSPAERPDRKFVFTPEQFTAHYTPTELGASYSIWIPWDEVGGVRRAISLMPVFRSTDGNVVMGHQSINILPGKTPKNVDATPKGYFTPLSPSGSQDVRPASYERPEHAVASTRDHWAQTHTFVPKDASRERLRTTTIQVPMTMSKRLMQARVDGEMAAGNQGTGPERKTEAPRRIPPISEENVQGLEPSKPVQQSSEVSATASPPATRFARPRYLAPRAPDGRPNHVHAATPRRPEVPQPGRPSPRSWDHSGGVAGF